MKNTFLYLTLIVLIVSCGNSATQKKDALLNLDKDITTYYLIRHAEKDRTDSTNTNPKLNEKGLERAKNWASYFDSIPLDQIYSTNYHRTQSTVSYIATHQNVAVESYDPANLYDEDFQISTQGETVLIVGHSNTTPRFVNAIVGDGTYPDMDDNDNAALYVVKVFDGKTEVEVRRVE